MDEKMEKPWNHADNLNKNQANKKPCAFHGKKTSFCEYAENCDGRTFKKGGWCAEVSNVEVLFD